MTYLPFDKAARPDLLPDELEHLDALYKGIAALRDAEVNLRQEFGPSLRLSIVDARAVRAWEDQWQPYFNAHPGIEGRYYGTWKDRDFIPERLDDDYLTDYVMNFYKPAAFNVAIWHGETLCGIGCGGYRDEHLRGFTSVQLREANPDPEHPLKGKIGAIIHESALEHARKWGVDRVIYIGPYSPGAIKVHESMGFRKEKLEVLPGEFLSAVYVGYVPRLQDRAPVTIIGARP